jgi:hypothetical protein
MGALGAPISGGQAIFEMVGSNGEEKAALLIALITYFSISLSICIC